MTINNLFNFGQNNAPLAPASEIIRPFNAGFAPSSAGGALPNATPATPAVSRPQFDRFSPAFGGTSAMPEPNAAKNGEKAENKPSAAGSSKDVQNDGRCYTCENRRYQDGSDDSGVSFQQPTRVAPQAAASAVRSHEAEHVSREQSKAQREDRKVVSQTVQIHTAVCQECGKVYVSGGTTRTTTKGTYTPPSARPPQPDSGIGTLLNQVA